MTARERDQHDRDHGYMPPRHSGTEAIDRAIANAERYLRSYRGILRTFQHMRNRLGTVIMTGGQLNVAERQMVMPLIESGAPAPHRPEREVMGKQGRRDPSECR